MSRQHSIVRHKANYFFQMLEDDYILMYQALAEELDPIKISKEEKVSAPADCKAMIASVLEHWMNSKRPTAKCEEDLYVYFTYPEWETALRYRYKRSTIIQCLKEMETEGSYIDEEGDTHTGTIKKRHFVQNTFQYVLNLPVLQALLEKLPEVSPFDTYEKPMLGRPHKNRVKINDIKINGLISDDRSVKIDDRDVKTNAPFYTQITQTNTDLEDTYVDVRSREIDAHTSENNSQQSVGSSPQDIYQPDDDYPIANPTLEPIESVGVPIGNAARLVEKACYTTPEEYDACLQVFLEALGAQWKAMDKATRGLWSAYKQQQLDAWKAINPKPAKPKPVLLAEEKALQHELQEWINKKRGYKLHGRAPAKEIFAEQNAVQTLAHMLYEQLIVGNEEDGATWEELTYEWEHIKKHDPFWSKPDNRVRIGGFALLQKFAPVIHEYRSTKKRTSNDTGNTTPKQETTSVLGVSGQRHFEFAPLPFRKAR